MKKFLSVLLAVCLLAGCLPLSASALSSYYSNHSSAYTSSKYYSQLSAVNLTGNYASDIVAVALSQKGYHEANSTAGYGGSTSGSGNYCEYNRNYWGKDVSGSNYAWCTIFIMWCARQARIPTSIIPNNLTTVTSGTNNFYSKMPNYNAVRHSPSGYTPQKGDLLITGDGNHIGIVTANASGGKVTYISGNINDCVDTRTLNVTSAKAYITPNYGNIVAPPGPVTNIWSDKAVYSTSDKINIYWDPVAGTTEYWIYLWKDGKEIYHVNMGTNTAHTSAPLSTGKYTVIIRPGNSYGFNDGSKSCTFTVTETGGNQAPAPTNPWMKANKTELVVGENITFTYGASNATAFLMGIDRNGTRIQNVQVGASGYSASFSDAGSYSVYVTCSNSSGWVDSNRVTFTVKPSVPAPTKPWIKASKTEVDIGENITFTYGASDAVYFWLGIDKGNTRIRTVQGDTSGYTTSFSEPGTYSIYVTCTNDSGGIDSTPITFRVKESDTPLDPTPENSFIDVPNGAYFAEAVNWAVDKGITAGTSSNTFSPNAICTRAQAVTFLWRAAGSPEPSGGSTKFVDVASGQYYTKAVQWAVEKGITGGTSATTFSPNDKCTRAQIVTFQYRMHNSPSVSGVSPFADVPPTLYYANAVAWAVENGITSGTSASTFSPHNDCSRGQIVTFLYRDAQ